MIAEFIADQMSPSMAVQRGEALAQLRVALDGLDATDREVLALRHFEEPDQQRGRRSAGHPAGRGEQALRPGAGATQGRTREISRIFNGVMSDSTLAKKEPPDTPLRTTWPRILPSSNGLESAAVPCGSAASFRAGAGAATHLAPHGSSEPSRRGFPGSPGECAGGRGSQCANRLKNDESFQRGRSSRLATRSSSLATRTSNAPAAALSTGWFRSSDGA